MCSTLSAIGKLNYTSGFSCVICLKCCSTQQTRKQHSTDNSIQSNDKADKKNVTRRVDTQPWIWKFSLYKAQRIWAIVNCEWNSSSDSSAYKWGRMLKTVSQHKLFIHLIIRHQTKGGWHRYSTWRKVSRANVFETIRDIKIFFYILYVRFVCLRVRVFVCVSFV